MEILSYSPAIWQKTSRAKGIRNTGLGIQPNPVFLILTPKYDLCPFEV